MKFIDETVITVRAGNGGSGCLSFRREKYIPFGGPDGGDGGNGGSIIIRGTDSLNTLADFKNKSIFSAENGKAGGSRNKHCILYTSPSPRDATLSRMPSSA